MFTVIVACAGAVDVGLKVTGTRWEAWTDRDPLVYRTPRGEVAAG
jgi:hypothetical protein